MRKEYNCTICDITMIYGFKERHNKGKEHKGNIQIPELFISDLQ